MKSTNQEGYNIPDNYFNSSREKTLKMLDSLENESKSPSNKNRNKSTLRGLYPIGIAASLLLVAGVLLLGDDQVDSTLANADETELLVYLETYIDDYTLDELIDIDTLGLDTNSDFEDADYMDYLEEVDIDDLYDLM